MTPMQAWEWITQRWGSTTWVPIDPAVRKILCLPDSLGLAHGMLITRTGANGSQEFIKRLNARGA